MLLSIYEFIPTVENATANFLSIFFSVMYYLNWYSVTNFNYHAEPTGVLIDSARTLVTSQIPEDSVDDRREALHRASNLALTRGVTTVVDMGRYYPGFSTELSWDDFSGLIYKFELFL